MQSSNTHSYDWKIIGHKSYVHLKVVNAVPLFQRGSFQFNLSKNEHVLSDVNILIWYGTPTRGNHSL